MTMNSVMDVDYGIFQNFRENPVVIKRRRPSKFKFDWCPVNQDLESGKKTLLSLERNEIIKTLRIYSTPGKPLALVASVFFDNRYRERVYAIYSDGTESTPLESSFRRSSKILEVPFQGDLFRAVR